MLLGHTGASSDRHTLGAARGKAAFSDWPRRSALGSALGSRRLSLCAARLAVTLPPGKKIAGLGAVFGTARGTARGMARGMARRIAFGTALGTASGGPLHLAGLCWPSGKAMLTVPLGRREVPLHLGSGLCLAPAGMSGLSC